MNSLSILSSRVEKVIGNTPPSTPSAEAFKEIRQQQQLVAERVRSETSHLSPLVPSSSSASSPSSQSPSSSPRVEEIPDDEEEDLQLKQEFGLAWRFYSDFMNTWNGAFRWVLSTIAFSTSWVTACFYDDDAEGSFSILMPLKRLARVLFLPAPAAAKNAIPLHPRGHRQSASMSSIRMDETGPDSALTSSSSSFTPTSSHHLRSRSLATASDSPYDDIQPRRSIRIRLYNEKSQSSSSPASKSKLASVKSPTSPATSLRLTKYPRNTGPPQPLLSRTAQKTLILDLDETLIHSLAKGGRMTSGHMVEVKLDRQHAILYYVHKRPYCDEFLRKVYKWYNLVIFTASVQEYADPVIDWLEQDRKYFKGRYYRQHCTNRNGAYIKDLSAIEPDLSKVIILDNSPMSYMFHPDNAIPIEGWINDPTDIDLLNLIPLLQALHYVTDVRALLALRMGEAFT